MYVGICICMLKRNKAAEAVKKYLHKQKTANKATQLASEVAMLAAKAGTYKKKLKNYKRIKNKKIYI